jgi:hypothetical protein
MKRYLLFLLLAFFPFYAQAQSVPVGAGVPPNVNASASYTGARGGISIFYYVCSRYPAGYTCMPSAVIVGGTLGIGGLGGGNSVTVNWSPGVPGATGYDVIRMATNGAFNGTCSNGCAIALNQTGTSYVDASSASGSNYPPGGLNPATAAQGQIRLDNVDYPTPGLVWNLLGVPYPFGLLPPQYTPGDCIAFGAVPPFLVDTGSGCGSGSGFIQSHGTLTTTAIVTDFDATHVQTPSATSTLDSSGDAAFQGNVAAVGALTVGLGSGTPSSVGIFDGSSPTQLEQLWLGPTTGYAGIVVYPAAAPTLNQVLTCISITGPSCQTGWASPSAAGITQLTGPVTAGPGSGSQATKLTLPMILNSNAASLPTPQTGTVLQIGNADTVNTRIEADSFAASSFFTAIRADGTAAARTALLSGDQIGGYNSWGYNGTATVGPAASLRTFASANWSGTANGTYADIVTTPSAGTTAAEVIRFENDGGVTVPSTVTGGDKGAGTINAGGLYVNGVAVSTGTGVTSFTGDGALSNNSASTGAVTFTLANAAKNTVWGNPTGSPAVGGYTANPIVTSAASQGSVATDEASLGPELTASGTCTATGWTGSYPTYTNGVSNTGTIDCTIAGIGSGQFYQVVATITAYSAGSITIAIGSTTAASGVAATTTIGPETTGTGDFIITPTSTFVGTVTISVKLITAISLFAFRTLDSASAQSVTVSQTLSGQHNLFIGGATVPGTLSTTGTSNVGIGPNNTMLSMTTGNQNTAIGAGALKLATTGSGNSAYGQNALDDLTFGAQNTAIGQNALMTSTTSNQNTAVGQSALQNNTTGGNNVGIGYTALQSGTTGTNNVGVGSGAALSAVGDSNEIVIGASTTGAGSNKAVIGNSSVTDVYLGSSTGAANIHCANCGSLSGGTNGFQMWQLTVPASASFTSVNFGGATAKVSGTHFLSIAAEPSTTDGLQVLNKACPASPWSLFSLVVLSEAVASIVGVAGVEVDDGTHYAAIMSVANATSSIMATQKYASATSGGSVLSQDGSDVPILVPVWYNIQYSGTALSFYYSFDGVGTPGTNGGWRALTTAATPASLGLSAVTNCGFFAQADSASTGASATALAFQFGTLTAQ